MTWLIEPQLPSRVALTLEYDLATIAGLTGGLGGDPKAVLSEFMQTQLVVLTSHSLCVTAFEALERRIDSSAKRAAARVLTHGAHPSCDQAAQRIGESLVIEIQYHDQDAIRGQAFLTALADAYLQRALQSDSEAENQAFIPLSQELRTRNAELSGIENEMSRFASEVGLGAFEAQESVLLDMLRRYSQEIASVRIQRIRLEAKASQSDSTRSDTDAAYIPDLDDGLQQVLQKRVSELQSDARGLALRSEGQHPMLPAIRAELESVQRELTSHQKSKVQLARSELLAIQRQERELERMIEQSQRALLDLARHRPTYSRLLRTAADADALRKAVIDRLDKKHTSPGASGWFARVLSPAHVLPRWPVVTISLLLTVVAVALALLFPTRGARELS